MFSRTFFYLFEVHPLTYVRIVYFAYQRMSPFEPPMREEPHCKKKRKEKKRQDKTRKAFINVESDVF